MAGNPNNDGNIILGLDIPKSKANIKEDLKTILDQIKNLKIQIDKTKLSSEAKNDLKKQLNSLKNSIKITDIKLGKAEINTLKSQLDNIQIDLSNVTINATTLNNIVTQINNALNGIQINNININPNGVSNVGDVISRELKDAIDDITSPEIEVGFIIDPKDSGKFKSEVDKMISKLQNEKSTAISYKLNTQTTFDEESQEYMEQLTSAVFQYTTATGEAIRKTIQYNNANKEWVESSASYSKALNTMSAQTDKFIEKRIQAVASVRNELSTIIQKITDPNASKTLAHTDFDSNGLTASVQSVISAMDRLDNASQETFTQANIDAKETIVSLKNLATTLVNTEYVATSLRAKQFETVKTDELNNLLPILEKIRNSSHADDIYDDSINQSLVQRAEQLASALENATDPKDIIEYLNGLSNLESRFDSIIKIANATNKELSLSAKASKTISEIQMFADANPKIDKDFKYDINGITASLSDLLEELKNVDSQPHLTKIKDQFSAIKSKAEETGKATKKFVTDFEKDLKKANEAIDKDKYIGKVADISKKFDKLDGSLIDESLEADFNTILALSKELNSSMSNEEKVSAYRQLENLIPSITNRMKELSASQADIDLGRKIKESINNKDYDVKFDKVKQDLFNLGLTSDEVALKLENLDLALEDLKDKDNGFDDLIGKERIFNSELEKTQNEVKILAADLDKVYDPQKQIKLSNDIQNWLSKNTRASKEAKDSLTDYYKELQGGRVTKSRLQYISQELQTIDAQQRGLGKLGKNLIDQFKEAGNSFTQWLSVTNGIMFLVEKSKQAVTELIDVDDILTEVSKTSDLAKNELIELGDAAYDTASKYGRAATDYLTGVQEMYRAGFENAAEMAELSLLAQAAGDMDATGANNYIMATNAAYDYKASVEDLNAVLDSQNYITNNAAINMQDMADATSEAASIAAQYGVEIDELSALISVAVSKTRETGSEVGTALKALFINLQDTTSKPIRNAFDGVGISMTKMVNGAEKLKTPIELIKELSVAFNSLDEGSIERANILNDIGGKVYHVVQKCATCTYLIAGNA